jgi:hypothetical protein
MLLLPSEEKVAMEKAESNQANPEITGRVGSFCPAFHRNFFAKSDFIISPEGWCRTRLKGLCRHGPLKVAYVSVSEAQTSIHVFFLHCTLDRKWLKLAHDGSKA